MLMVNRAHSRLSAETALLYFNNNKVIMTTQFLRCCNTVTNSRAPYKPILKIRCMQQRKHKVQWKILVANRNVFRAVLKLFTDEQLRMEHGNWFHAATLATTNLRSPKFVLIRRTTRSPRPDDWVRPSTQDCSQSWDRYTGVGRAPLA